MRDKVIEALAYPRFQVRVDLELDECPHSGLYDGHDRQCLNCESKAQCRWLYRNDEFAAMEAKPAHELIGALEFALDYMDAQTAAWGHNRDTCHCDACRWLRRTSALYQSLIMNN